MSETSKRKAYDVIIVGAGSMGMSAGYYLARSGVRTLLIDAFDPPHGEGSHHGEPRLIRHAYSGGAAYIELALRAQRLWEEAEASSGLRLFERSGVLNMADPKVYSLHGRLSDAVRQGVQAEWLNAAEIRHRWPGIELPERFEGLYEPDAGYLHSESCVTAYRNLALAHGAELIVNTPVTGITAREGSVTVHTASGDYAAGAAILSAGAWFRTLAPFIELPIQAVRKVVGWFETQGGGFDAGRFPGFTLGTEHGGFYGFPSIQGAGLKIGRHDQGIPWHPGETPDAFGTYPEDEGDLRSALAAVMPQAAGRLLRSAVCKYELTPDEHFIIDRHPEHRHVWIAGGFSGHGFKFSSVIGEQLALLAQHLAPTADLRQFALSRFNPAPSSPAKP
ncbi:N-methyl-L-tryptophan oxidase [Paenibacillus phyllosphaerae]|uniref:N-methyl-L-tryptophan oxidase n=1 Tax=Paenibacillus phyllosphaerae TaxID=274593 RepID=A0A7W5B123_9BACL|nr:N-methyl-L-tryptophan oxidase [Paenibacillus phyllosphaerae]MBB3112485.1 N-methyl-L-tryptophan oxidase [Paenibacillus phyllosphaerae]